MIIDQLVPLDIHVIIVPVSKALTHSYAFSLSRYREQRQKEATKMATATAVVNSFPKDRDYRREAMQAAPTSFTPTSEYQPVSHLCSQSFFILSSAVGFKKLLVSFVSCG